ncbi:HupE/UreJ family protein [Luteolibacter sp. LG18]|uniref:HupE/UreJ family protein n=1 Tax=Luteolibacter sp. LG18 TaxID=2819286 RepID=UPI0030C72380
MKRRLLPIALVSLLGTAAANAHVVTTGLGPLYDGASHFALSPETCVPLAAIGLFAGLRGAAAARKALFIIPVAWLIGGHLGLTWGTAPGYPLAAATFLVLGLLIATDCKLKPAFVAGLAAIVTALHGWIEGLDLRTEGGGTMATLGGAVVAAIFFLLASGLVLALKPAWTRIVVRVLGSWLAATGLLMTGWWLHPPKSRQGADNASICPRTLVASSANPAFSQAATSPLRQAMSFGNAFSASR